MKDIGVRNLVDLTLRRLRRERRKSKEPLGYEGASSDISPGKKPRQTHLTEMYAFSHGHGGFSFFH